MRWKNLTAKEFPEAVRKAKGVCLLPVGILEKHGDHLPLGTDLLYADKTAELASKKEPVIVFPIYYFWQIYEAKHTPGTVAIKPEITLELLESVCDEIARNGLKKIIIFNGHGGNWHLLSYFAQCTLSKKKDYIVYLTHWAASVPKYGKMLKKIIKKGDGHGGTSETAAIMALFPKLVKMKDIWNKPSNPLRRLPYSNSELYTGIWWYADFPEHYGGDGRYGNKKIGKMMVKYEIEHLVEVIKTVKKDDMALKLQNEFFNRVDNLTKIK